MWRFDHARSIIRCAGLYRRADRRYDSGAVIQRPDAPAYFCDVCGYRAFDEDFLASMHYLIRQAMDDSQRRKRKRQPVQQPDARPIPPARQRR